MLKLSGDMFRIFLGISIGYVSDRDWVYSGGIEGGLPSTDEIEEQALVNGLEICSEIISGNVYATNLLVVA